jgi:hypothetical protein
LFLALYNCVPLEHSASLAVCLGKSSSHVTCASAPLLLQTFNKQAAVTEATADEVVRKFLWNAYLRPCSKAIGWILDGFNCFCDDGLNFPTLQVPYFSYLGWPGVIMKISEL